MNNKMILGYLVGLVLAGGALFFGWWSIDYANLAYQQDIDCVYLPILKWCIPRDDFYNMGWFSSFIGALGAMPLIYLASKAYHENLIELQLLKEAQARLKEVKEKEELVELLSKRR